MKTKETNYTYLVLGILTGLALAFIATKFKKE